MSRTTERNRIVQHGYQRDELPDNLGSTSSNIDSIPGIWSKGARPQRSSSVAILAITTIEFFRAINPASRSTLTGFTTHAIGENAQA